MEANSTGVIAQNL